MLRGRVFFESPGLGISILLAGEKLNSPLLISRAVSSNHFLDIPSMVSLFTPGVILPGLPLMSS